MTGLNPTSTRRRHCIGALLLTGLLAGGRSTAAIAQSVPGRTERILRVGPTAPIRRISDAARLARDGDIVEIEPGDYAGDVAVWKQKRLTIRRAPDPGGRTAIARDPVRLIAAGQAAEGKAIWVVRNGVFDVEGIEFHGARVPDRNGAGIRFQGGRLTVRDCRFLDNETGILTGNDGRSELYLESCEFEGRAQPGDGFTHNLYVGAIARFEMRACWSHHGNAGHLVKTRARENRLLYNRLTDEPGGRASYEIDCPNGGVLVAVGNLVEQQPTTQNNAMLSYGAEGWRWPLNRLVLAHNTFVNRREIGTFVRAYPGQVDVFVANNLFVGKGISEGIGDIDGGGNHYASPREFRDATGLDMRLAPDSRLRGRAVSVGGSRGRQAGRGTGREAGRDAASDANAELMREAVPIAEYEHPRRLKMLLRAPGSAEASKPASGAEAAPFAVSPPSGKLAPGAFQS